MLIVLLGLFSSQLKEDIPPLLNSFSSVVLIYRLMELVGLLKGLPKPATHLPSIFFSSIALISVLIVLAGLYARQLLADTHLPSISFSSDAFISSLIVLVGFYVIQPKMDTPSMSIFFSVALTSMLEILASLCATTLLMKIKMALDASMHQLINKR
jgi:hypothetical protein